MTIEEENTASRAMVNRFDICILFVWMCKSESECERGSDPKKKVSARLRSQRVTIEEIPSES
jgi:hypothetical protein